jgi:acetyltransferase-like isoleucine patch superfamily enzyme
MCVANWILVIILIIFVLDFCFLAVYCRLERKLEIRRKARKNDKTVTSNNENDKRATNNKVNIFKKAFGFLEPYFYGLMRYSTIIVGKIPSHRIRNFFMRYVFCMQITKNTVIYGGCEIRSPWNIKADRCVISTYCILDGRNGIEIGNDVVFGGGVHIWTEEHNIDDEYFLAHEENKKGVIIDEHAWICSDSTILPGVHVGKGAVVASRAVLTKDADVYGVYAGIPAKKIKERNNNLKYKLNGKPTWHFY